MANLLQPGFVLIEFEASYPAECRLEHDGGPSQAISSVRQLELGGAGTVLKTPEEVRDFDVGDAVVACLSDQDIFTDCHGEKVASIHESLLSKLPDGVSKNDAARIPMAFAIATGFLHSTAIISLPLADQPRPPTNVLLVAGNTVVPLMTIRLLLLYTVTTVFIVYEAETIVGPLSIDPAMIAGAHFAQQPSSTANLQEVARGLRSNLGHYGPYSGKDCFDVVLDLTGKANTPESYRRLLCPANGRLFQLPQTMHVNFDSMFVESGIMKELELLLAEGEIKAENLYVHPNLAPANPSKTPKTSMLKTIVVEAPCKEIHVEPESVLLVAYRLPALYRCPSRENIPFGRLEEE